MNKMPAKVQPIAIQSTKLIASLSQKYAIRAVAIGFVQYKTAALEKSIN